ncbi:cytochrome P450 3A4 [Rhipicephalus sanguineus]|uniref:cytochrome P450 3A4 n=1 Tax=Rhipicephalus sanguineus TaxID=34632 RepID=UPI0018962F83|nr:cytochrome P450 3A4 [Rhipicephalus sanguineus]
MATNHSGTSRKETHCPQRRQPLGTYGSTKRTPSRAMFAAFILSFVIAFAAWFIIQRKRRLSFFRDLGIPGPPPSFISGNLSELIHKGAAAAFKEWMEKYGDFVGFYNGAFPVLIVKDPELIKKIQIKDFGNFHSRGVLSGFARIHPINKLNLVNTPADRWKEMRSLLTPAFTTSNMKKMANLMDACTNEFLDVLKFLHTENKVFEARELFQRLTADVIIRSAFGLKSDLQLKKGSKSTTESLFQDSLRSFQQFRCAWMSYLTSSFPEFAPLWKVILSFKARYSKTATDNILDDITPILQFRRKNTEVTRNDILQLMLNAEVEEGAPVSVHSLAIDYDADSTSEKNEPTKVGKNKKKRFLTNEEILSNGLVFFIAGFETTGTAMSFMAYLLAKHPDIQDRLREEILAVLERDGAFTYDNVFGIKYLDQVISESLRYYSPVVGFTTRRCSRDYTHNGTTIPAGTSVLIPGYHMSHDPTFWEEPEKFDPDRFSNGKKGQVDPMVYQPFGQGPRNCIGMRFAQLEMKLTMAKTLAKYKFVLDDRHVNEKSLEIGSSFIFAYPQGGIWLKIEECL